MVIMMDNKFIEIQEKFKRGVYQELGLLTDEERKKDSFKIELFQEKELLEECQKYIDQDSIEEFLMFLEKDKCLGKALDYFHHHFLNGNMIFTYALSECSRRWTINYLKENGESFIVPSRSEDVFLSFLSFLSEKDIKDRYHVQIPKIEYYLFVLETLGKIERKNHQILLTDDAYLEGMKLFNQQSLHGK